MSARFVNMSYAQVSNESSPQRIQNIYVDTGDMNKIYDVVTKDVNHGVNQFNSSIAPTNTGGAEGGKDLCEDDFDVPLKCSGGHSSDRAKMPLPPAPCMNNLRLYNSNREGQEYMYVDTPSKPVKNTNIQAAASRVSDPAKPSNLSHEEALPSNPHYEEASPSNLHHEEALQSASPLPSQNMMDTYQNIDHENTYNNPEPTDASYSNLDQEDASYTNLDDLESQPLYVNDDNELNELREREMSSSHNALDMCNHDNQNTVEKENVYEMMD